MATEEEYSEDFFEGPAYALVIGISEYEHQKEANQELAENEFPRLKLAAKDAEDFSGFLQKHGFLEGNVQTLLNHKATREEIIGGFENLRKCCRESEPNNPLVIVYFSGHGWADESGHYLVPHDASANKLAQSALSNEDLTAKLNKLDTNRLVVFIDACHAGAIGEVGARGPQTPYDFAQGLGQGNGRYIISSCMPDQKSYELDDNGIFTGHLLELLEFKTDDFNDKEELDVDELYPVLRDKVKATAKREKGGAQQEPTHKADGSGIVLAINQRFRQRKRKEEFLTKVCDGIRELDPNDIIITTKLEDYVAGEKLPGHDNFYRIFEGYWGYWKNGAQVTKECAQVLITRHKKIIEPNRRALDLKTNLGNLRSTEQIDAIASAPTAKQSPSVASAPDTRQAAVEIAEKIVAGREPSTAPESVAHAPDRAEQRQLSEDDCIYILGEEISRKIDYLSISQKLRAALRGPVNDEQFCKMINTIGNEKNDSALDEILQNLATRFQERWKQAPPPKTASSLRLGR